MTNEEKINELVSLSLWAARRLKNDSRKVYVYEDVLDIIGDDHIYSESIKEDLQQLLKK